MDPESERHTVQNSYCSLTTADLTYLLLAQTSNNKTKDNRSTDFFARMIFPLSLRNDKLFRVRGRLGHCKTCFFVVGLELSTF